MKSDSKIDWGWVVSILVSITFIIFGVLGFLNEIDKAEKQKTTGQVENAKANTATEKQVIVIPDDDPPGDFTAESRIRVGIIQKHSDGLLKERSAGNTEIKITDRRTVKINGIYLFWFSWEETGTGQGLCYGEICFKRSGTEWTVHEFYCLQRK